MPTDTEIAWAAGLFEGEGSLIVHHTRRYGAASLATTDRDVIDRFHAVVGFGAIHVVTSQAHRAHTHWKQCYQWNVWNAAQVRQLVAAFWPYLGERRRARATEVLAAIEGVGTRGQSKYQTHCKHGHEFTEENTYRNPKTRLRSCRACARERRRKRHEANSKMPK